MVDNLKAIKNIEETIKNIKNNDFNLYFFVVDSKNVPNGSLTYIYQMAKTLNDKGYNVKMLYQLDNEYTEAELYKLNKKEQPIDPKRVFTGVKDWLGEEFSSLPHMNISTEEWKVSPSDFLFIPEAFSSLMYQTYKHKIPCKRIVILQNYNYVTDFIPIGVEWKNYGIFDAISSNDNQTKMLKDVFPYVNVRTVKPCIPEYFRPSIKPKKLIVNIISKQQSDVNKIVKPFFWKYPIYKFISFRDLRNFPREHFAELLQESAITIWLDDETPFGYSAIEAMKCGNIVIGKVPEIVPEWMGNNTEMFNNGFWVYNINDIPTLLSKVIASWMQDKIPQEIYDNMEKTSKMYGNEEWEYNVENTFKEIINEQVNNFNEVKTAIENKINEQA